MITQNQPQLDVPQLVLEAHERCKEHLSPTPLEYSRYLSETIVGEVWLKLDSMQRTGSFKFRGALNKILSLTEAELDKGIVSVSTGNYALAVAEAAIIFVEAVAGVEVGTEIVWQSTGERSLPRFLVVNKMDRENVSVQRVMQSISETEIDPISLKGYTLIDIAIEYIRGLHKGKRRIPTMLIVND